MKTEDNSEPFNPLTSKIVHHLEFEFDRSAGLIFITGGHGIISYRVASRLLNAGYPTIRVGAFHADELSDLNKLGAEVADFSWGKDETYEKALKGVKTVFCVPSYHKDWDEDFELFLKACQEAGVEHMVKMSFLHAHRPDDKLDMLGIRHFVKKTLLHAKMHDRELEQVPLVASHGKCDEKLMHSGSGIAYTIIGASHLMSNPILSLTKGQQASEAPLKLYGASAGKAVNYVSPNDVAEVAARTLLAPHNHVDKIYELTGPVAIKEAEVAKYLEKFMNKAVVYVDEPIEVFEEEEVQSGVPSWLLQDKVSLEKIKALGHEGDASFRTSDVEKVCYHKPETYLDYLTNVDAMSPQERALLA